LSKQQLVVCVCVSVCKYTSIYIELRELNLISN